jgi:ankyrin repeat protein
MVRFLESYLANNGNPDDKGQNDLHRAAIKNDTAEIQRLVRNKPHLIDVQDNLGNSALALATKRGYVEASQILLLAEANVRLLNASGDNLVDQAARGGSEALVELFLDDRLLNDPLGNEQRRKRFFSSYNTLKLAFSHNRPKAAKYLMERGAVCEVSEQDKRGYSKEINQLIADFTTRAKSAEYVPMFRDRFKVPA